MQTNPAVKLQFDVLSDNVQALLSSFGIAAPALGSLKAKGLIHADTEWTPDALAFEVLLKNANGSFGFAVWPENAEPGGMFATAMKLWMSLVYVPFK